MFALSFNQSMCWSLVWLNLQGNLIISFIWGFTLLHPMSRSHSQVRVVSNDLKWLTWNNIILIINETCKDGSAIFVSNCHPRIKRLHWMNQMSAYFGLTCEKLFIYFPKKCKLIGPNMLIYLFIKWEGRLRSHNRRWFEIVMKLSLPIIKLGHVSENA
jgi:hypothetical protein